MKVLKSVLSIFVFLFSLSANAQIITVESSINFDFGSTVGFNDRKQQRNTFFLDGFDQSLGQLVDVQISLDSVVELDSLLSFNSTKTCDNGGADCTGQDALIFEAESYFEQYATFDLISHDPNDVNDFVYYQSTDMYCFDEIAALDGEIVEYGCSEADSLSYDYDLTLGLADFGVPLSDFFGGMGVVEIALANIVDYFQEDLYCDTYDETNPLHQCSSVSDKNSWMGSLSVTYTYDDLSEAVPEPESLLIFTLGLLALSVRRQQKN